MNRPTALKIGTVVICALIYISLIFNNNLWVDEAFSAAIIRDSFFPMLHRTVQDTLPPFYNVAAWCFTHIFGFSSVSLKLFSVIPMVLLMAVGMVFIPRVSSLRCAVCYAVLLTAMPHMIAYGIEIRMYSWACMFTSCTAIFALCYIKKLPHSMPFLITCTVLGAYTHQFALIAEALIWLMLLLVSVRDKRFKDWIKGALICFVCYIPCAVLTVYQMKKASGYFKASPADIRNLLASLRFPFVTNLTPVSLLLLLCVLSLLILAVIKRDLTAAWYIILPAVITFMSYSLMFITGSTFFSARYLLPAMGVLWLGAALAADHIPDSRVFRICFLIITLSSLVITYVQEFRTEYRKDQGFEEFAAVLNNGGAYTVYEDFPEIGICMEYYAPAAKECSIDELRRFPGKRYILVNENLTDPDPDLSGSEYVGNYSFDRYTFRTYILR